MRRILKIAAGFALCGLLLTKFCDLYFFKVNEAKVRLIIIDKTPIPHFLFTLSSIPLAVASYIKFGERSFSLVPANLASARDAFMHAEFLVVGTHGKDGYFVLDDGAWVGPRSLPKNDKLAHVYFGSCEFGARRAEWQQEYPHTDIIGHDGTTSPLRGWLYLFFEAGFRLLGLANVPS